MTLEVDTVGAQKLGLAGSIGTLSLLLRKAGETSAEKPIAAAMVMRANMRMEMLFSTMTRQPRGTLLRGAAARKCA